MASPASGTPMQQAPQTAQSNLARALAQHNRSRKPTSTSPPTHLKETAGSPPRLAARGPGGESIDQMRDPNKADDLSTEMSVASKQQAASPNNAESKPVTIDGQKGPPTREKERSTRSRKILAASPPSKRLLNTNASATDPHRKQLTRRGIPLERGGANASSGEAGIVTIQKATKASYTPEQRIALLVAKRQAAHEDQYQRRKQAYDTYREKHGLTGEAQDGHSRVLKKAMDDIKALKDIEYRVQPTPRAHKRKASTSGSSGNDGDATARVRRSPPSRSATTPMPKMPEAAETLTRSNLTDDVARMGISNRRHKAASSMSALPVHVSTDPNLALTAENGKPKRFFGLL